MRDYIHVEDLAQAHWRALCYLATEQISAAFNLGNGNGYSIREVIESARRVTGQAIKVEDAPRRQGDPAVLVADSARAHEKLGWTPQVSGLDEIVEHAWKWEKKNGHCW